MYFPDFSWCQAGTVLIEDVRIFNGVDARLTSGNVLVVDGLIADVSTDSIVAAAKFFLDHGFTSIRDAGGTHPDLARAFNSGTLYGPRVFPSGAIVSQTAGHGDWRMPHEANPVHTGGSPYVRT